MTSQPVVLCFHRTKQFVGEETTPQSDMLRVFVPCGHEDDAMQILGRFQVEVIEVRKRAERQWANPEEP